jgi:hypothetical protein
VKDGRFFDPQLFYRKTEAYVASKEERWQEANVKFHACLIKILANDKCIADRIKAMLWKSSFSNRQHTEFFFHIVAVESLRSLPFSPPPTEHRLPYPAATGTPMCYDTKDNFVSIYLYDRAFVTISLSSRKALLLFAKKAEAPPYNALEVIFCRAFFELLKTIDCYTIHSSCVCTDGKGILIPGYSDYGKTTFAMELVNRGFRLLADDVSILDCSKDSLKILAFTEDMALANDVCIQLGFENKGARRQPWRRDKKAVNVRTLYPKCLVSTCTPALMLFPRSDLNIKDEMIPLSAKESFELLLPHSLHVLGRSTTIKHFDSLWRLTLTVPGYAFWWRLNTDIFAKCLQKILL